MSEIVKFNEEVPMIHKSGFYTYSQNNSGGSFITDPEAGIAQYVIIEAFSPREADARALDIGIYFDERGDCIECCGYRWNSKVDYTYESADDFPQIYGVDVSNGKTMHGWDWDNPEAYGYIHYMSGQRTSITGYSDEEKLALEQEKNEINE